jgi:hypothetical protein
LGVRGEDRRWRDGDGAVKEVRVCDGL